LTYSPIFSSTPFHNALSWADAFVALPLQFQHSANPARLLEALLADNDQLIRFLFASFLPERFYGTIGRYPRQQEVIRELLVLRKGAPLRCLDAACGTGEDTYSLALLLSECGFPPTDVLVEGWTVEPLEVWAATQRRFPHDLHREVLLRKLTSQLDRRGYGECIIFHCADLTAPPAVSPPPRGDSGSCDLILCNGLLGGPLIHERGVLRRTVANLAYLLAPGGILLAADNFHGGWKQKCPQIELRALCEANGLKTFIAGEGIGGLKPD
jgi:SAM-dependent methyltransferase